MVPPRSNHQDYLLSRLCVRAASAPEALGPSRRCACGWSRERVALREPRCRGLAAVRRHPPPGCRLPSPGCHLPSPSCHLPSPSSRLPPADCHYPAGDAETGGAGAPPDHCFGSGRGIRTPDLRVMSPMSYRCSIPRRRAASIARAAVRPVAPLGAIPAPAHGRAHERRCYKVEVRRRGITDVPDEGSSPRPLVPLSYTHCCASTCGLSSG